MLNVLTHSGPIEKDNRSLSGNKNLLVAGFFQREMFGIFKLYSVLYFQRILYIELPYKNKSQVTFLSLSERNTKPLNFKIPLNTYFSFIHSAYELLLKDISK